MHAEEAVSLLAPLIADERFTSWQLARTDGSLVGRGAGGVELLRATRLGRPAGRLLAVVPDQVLDGLYGPIGRHRRLLGRLVPDGPAPRRFP